MVTAGIDTSFTSTGFTVVRDGKVVFETIKTAPKDFTSETARIVHIRDEIISKIPFDCSRVFMEDVFISHGPAAGNSLRLALLAGCVRAGLFDKGIGFEVIQPSLLKKYVSGKGNATKDVMMMMVLKKWGVETEDNNQADSVGLAMMAYEGFVVEPPVKKKKKQED